MSEFLTAVDIANRALQHCGSELIDASQGFAEQSKRAQVTSFAYPKLRRAELRRNVWRFATRKAALRPVDTNTLILVPTMWGSSSTYFQGSIVSDENNNLWSSQVPDNTNNQPENSNTWEAYFGPMTVSLYDSSQFYFSGELVYTAAGDGTNNVYRSLTNVNAVHPALSNQWSTFAVYSKDQVVQQFPAWAGGTSYSQGQSVNYTDGNIYSSLTNANVGHTPSTSTTNWALMPTLTLASQSVPISTVLTPPQSSPILEWAQTTTYALAAFVIFNGNVYVSLAANNTGNFPNAAASTFWAKATGGTLYMSLTNLNIGNNPATTTVAAWSSVTTYAIGNTVTGSDGVIYSSLINGNVNFDPVIDGGVHWQNTGTLSPWTTVFVQGGGNSQWTQIGGKSFPNGVGLTTLNVIYPVNSGPFEQTVTRNIFRLPNGYLRTAPQDPKAGSTSYLGAPSGLVYNDWEFEGDFIVTREVQPIVFRFVADLMDVTKFDDLFCEGLSARLGLEVCEPLTQSSAKVQTIMQEYNRFMGEARTANAIEIGSEEPPEDDYISCRV